MVAFQNSRPFWGHVFHQENHINGSSNELIVNTEAHIPQPTLAQSFEFSNPLSMALPSEESNTTRSVTTKETLNDAKIAHDAIAANSTATGAINHRESAIPNAQKKPNVLFIMADDLRPQLGLYGHRAYTPNLDALAERGTTFERAYAQITVRNKMFSQINTC